MKKYLYILFATCLFSSCNNDNLFDDPWGISSEFEKTNLSAIEVLSSAEAWRGVELYYYTETNGKGDKYHLEDPSELLGISEPIYVFTPNTITSYEYDGSIPAIYYIESALENVDGKMFRYKFLYDESYMKVLDYDEENVLIETNGHQLIRNDITYDYAIIHFKQFDAKPGWKDKYLTYEEYVELLKELGRY